MSEPGGRRLFAVADDLTGAVACGAELRRAGLRVVVRALEGLDGDDGADVLVIDTASRGLTAAGAADRVRAAVAGARNVLGDAATAYKRVDSGLRGHVGAELAAFRDAVGLAVVVAPAAPAYGFTTIDGAQLVDGAPVSAAAYGGVGDAPGEPRLRALLPGAAVLGLSDVRGERLPTKLAAAAARAPFVVCDGERTADLAAVARAAAALAEPVALAGSYGLAGAVGALRAGRAQARVVVVAGSPQPATARQLAELAEQGGAVEVVASPALAAGRAADPEVARALARDALRRALDGPLAGLVLVGGDTAAATLAAAGATGVELICEPWPATPVVRLLGGDLDGVPAVVKSGARGDARWLVHAIDVLRRGGW